LKGLRDDDARALRIVRDAMVAYPEYVSGTGEFDARLMESANGGIACKAGAEGVHGTAAIDRGAGLIVKVVDGASRGRAPSVLAALRRLGLLDEGALTKLADLERPIVYNRAGRAVGEIRAAEHFAVSTASTR
jgi:L-asparaginase II